MCSAQQRAPTFPNGIRTIKFKSSNPELPPMPRSGLASLVLRRWFTGTSSGKMNVCAT